MPVPRFWQRIEDRYKAGESQQFLLHTNIDDMIYDDFFGYLSTGDFLMEQMNRLGCNAVVSYTRSEGIQFPNLGIRNAYQDFMRQKRIEEIEPLPEDYPPVKSLNEDFRHVGEEALIREIQDALLRLEGFFRQGLGNARVGLLINDVEKLIPNTKIISVPDQSKDVITIAVETLQRWASDMQIKMRGHIILLLTENPAWVAPELILSDRHTTFPVELPLPGYQERLAYIRHLLYILEEEYKLNLPDGTLSENFANTTSGLRLKDIEALWLNSIRRKVQVTPNMVTQRLRTSLRERSYGRLGLLFGEYGLSTIGGLAGVIQYMQETIQAMRKEELKRVPMGILMLGSSGTGKTMLINALARDTGLRFIRLNNIRGNSTEARSDYDLYRTLNIIRSLAPVAVFIDEIDKICYTGADSYERKLMDNLIEMLVASISDPALRGRILWIAASNRPEMIHPEFRKRGRFDVVMPLLLPNVKEREDILRKVLSKNAIPYDNRVNFTTVSTRTDRCSGAELEVIAMRSFHNARKNERDAVIEQDLLAVADDFVPELDPAMYEYQTLLTIREANITSVIPRPLEGGLQDRVFDGNKINKTKINQRLRELKASLG
jgi:transitional endoplasmic reticulum ATPase